MRPGPAKGQGGGRGGGRGRDMNSFCVERGRRRCSEHVLQREETRPSRGPCGAARGLSGEFNRTPPPSVQMWSGGGSLARARARAGSQATAFAAASERARPPILIDAASVLRSTAALPPSAAKCQLRQRALLRRSFGGAQPGNDEGQI